MGSPDLEYNNKKAVLNTDEILRDFLARGKELYAKAHVEKNISYGDTPRETCDWFHANSLRKDALIFIHGGYWQACSKEDFAFIATTPLELGLDVILIEYNLAPNVPLTEICREVGAALDFIQHRLKADGFTGNVFLSGHSAGGHLTAHWHSHPVVTCSLPISGLFELSPIALTYLNDKLQLSLKEIENLSPMRHLFSVGKPVGVIYGANELPALIQQSCTYYAGLKTKGVDTKLIAVDGANHFTVLDKIFTPHDVVLQLISHFAEK